MRLLEFSVAIVGAVHRLYRTLGPNYEFPSLFISRKYAAHLADDLIGALFRDTKNSRSVMRGHRMAVVDLDRLRHALIIVLV